MQAQLPPCQDFEKLVKRPGPAGQHHDGIGVHKHDLFALMHGFGDDEPREVCLADLDVQQMRRYHAEGLAAGVLRRAGHRAHQPDIPRAIDQPPTCLCDCPAQGVCLGRKGRVVPGT